MIKLAILLLMLLIPNISSSQDKIKKFNIIILIDDHVILGGLESFKLDFEGKSLTLSEAYIPGSLCVDDPDGLLSATEPTPFKLCFSHTLYPVKNKSRKEYRFSYEIPLVTSWLRDPYIILRIYNTNIRPYKKFYFPLEGLNYTYEIDREILMRRMMRKERDFYRY